MRGGLRARRKTDPAFFHRKDGRIIEKETEKEIRKKGRRGKESEKDYPGALNQTCASLLGGDGGWAQSGSHTNGT